MRVYKTVDEYEKIAEKGDFIALGGKGIMDGIKTVNSKHDVYKVDSFKIDGCIIIKKYRGKLGFVIGAGAYDQEVAVLTKKEYSKLPVLW